NILKVIHKDQQLQRLTMHYSGWSLVEIDNINGWIPSATLTDIAPNKLEKNTNNNNLLKALNHHKNKVKDLSSKILKADKKLKDLQASYEKSITTIAKLTTDLDALTLENNRLLKISVEAKVKNSKEEKIEQKLDSSSVVPDSESTKATQVDHATSAPLNMNWLYYGAAGVFGVIALLAFSIYNRNKRRHFDLNTLRR
ncbi:MAG: hypothetical protein PSN35_05835, partial [Candidatus Thioglobus sp.]|uniref:hypothetical protein n=1 Tax=Candidatus Thioglobus sp. TaxID=2026721 RepID=UPI00263191E9